MITPAIMAGMDIFKEFVSPALLNLYTVWLRINNPLIFLWLQ